MSIRQIQSRVIQFIPRFIEYLIRFVRNIKLNPATIVVEATPKSKWDLLWNVVTEIADENRNMVFTTVSVLSVAFSFVTVPKLINAFTGSCDAFLSHNWGEHKVNHQRVKNIADYMSVHGVTTWIDQEKLKSGKMKNKILKGINQCRCFLVFITREYARKIATGNPSDYCLFELDYALRAEHLRRNDFQYIFPIILDKKMQRTDLWQGKLKELLDLGLMHYYLNDERYHSELDRLIYDINCTK